MLHIGFTGSRQGLTVAQRERLYSEEQWLVRWHVPTAFHHGDCLGADAQMHTVVRALARGYGFPLSVVVHPPVDARWRAWCVGDEMRVAQPYLVRNRAIVEETAWLIAAPATQREEQRSGTWATVRHARKVGREVVIVWPDGTMTREG